jgi:hypothetical protein
VVRTTPSFPRLVLVVAPFVLDYSDSGDATLFTIIAGVLEAVAALSTGWDPPKRRPAP